MTRAVAYLRVSTREQGKSGLGLEAQRETIERIARAESIDIIHWYTEVQSGAGDALTKRPQLAAALKHAKRIAGPIIVAKLDRLSRNLHFISGLMVEEVDFRCCDLPPEAPKFMLHIFAVLAEWERDQISERTRRALAAAKARGVKLGSPDPMIGLRAAVGASAASAARRAEAIAHDAKILAAAGAGTLAERCARLNAAGYRSAQDKPLTPQILSRMVRRAQQGGKN